MHGNHKKFYLNTLWQYGLQIIKYILPMLVMPYLTRVLEPSGYAVYAYVLSFMSFAQAIIDFGFNLSGVKQIAAHLGNLEKQNQVVGAITQARLLLCLIAAICCAVIGSAIPIMRENALYSSLAFVAVCGRSLAPDFLFQGHEQMGPLTTRYMLSKSVFIVLVYVFIHDAADLLWVPVLDIVTSLIALTWSFAVAKRRFGVGMKFVGAPDVVKELKRSGYYCATNMASTALSGVTTLVIGVCVSNADQVAYWSVAMTAVSAIQALYSPIINSLYPHMVVGGDYRFAKKLALLSIPFICVGTAVFYLLSDFIVMVLGGIDYMDGAYVLKLLTPIIPLSFYSMFFGWPVLGAAGRVEELTRSTVVSSICGMLILGLIWLSGVGSIAEFAMARGFTEGVLCMTRAAKGLRVLQGSSR